MIMADAGEIIWAVTGDVIIREAEGADIEGGDLLVWEGSDRRFLMQVVSLEHGSQADRRTHEMIAGMRMEGGRHSTEFFEGGFTGYRLAHAKPLAVVGRDGVPAKPKSIPPAFGTVRRAEARDLQFLPSAGPGRVFLGGVRSGSKTIEGAGLYMDAEKMFSHHVLVPATTGRGKSNLIKCMLYGLLGSEGVGTLVLDAHGEYFGGLSSHPRAAERLVYYSCSADPGSAMLRINVRSVNPHHFKGVVEFTEAQERMMWDLWGDHKREWIVRLFGEDGEDIPEQQKITRTVLRQKVRTALGIKNSKTFDMGTDGESTVSDIARHVEAGRVVVIDTSGLGSSVEMMIGCMAASRILWSYQTASENGELDKRPVAAIIMEEAPRLLGASGMGSGNPFATIAGEGRKFKVGICAITQLSSVIPKEIMANLNTKIILGNEMRAERDALVGSAAQDLSEDDRNIASLDKGEAIVSSVFVPFAVPIMVPLFDDMISADRAAAARTKPKVY